MNETIPHSLEGERVDSALAALAYISRARAVELLEQGLVAIDGVVVKTKSRKVIAGEALSATIPDNIDVVPQAEEDINFEIVYSDDDIVVIDKPAGLVVHPGVGNETGTLVHGLLARFGALPGDQDRPGIVHRLDAGTSGLMVIARSEAAYERLVQMLKKREVQRHYVTLVWGNLQPDNGMIDAPIGRSQSNRTKMAVVASGREARTRYSVLDRHDRPELSLVEARLETGRTHQIRVHMVAVGSPVVGDSLYGPNRHGVEISRPFLHARHLSFDHPVTGEALEFDSDLPDDLVKIVESLDLNP